MAGFRRRSDGCFDCVLIGRTFSAIDANGGFKSGMAVGTDTKDAVAGHRLANQRDGPDKHKEQSQQPLHGELIYPRGGEFANEVRNTDRPIITLWRCRSLNLTGPCGGGVFIRQIWRSLELGSKIGRLRAVCYLKLPHDVANVHLDRAFGHAQLVGDGLVGLSHAHEAQHFELPRRQ